MERRCQKDGWACTVLGSLDVWFTMKSVWQRGNWVSLAISRFQEFTHFSIFNMAPWRSVVKRWHVESIECSMGHRLCKQSTEGSLIDINQKGAVTLYKQSAAHIWPSQNVQIIFYSSFTCLTLVKALSTYNEIPPSKEAPINDQVK